MLDDDAASLCRRYVFAYSANLSAGATGVVDSDISRGMVHVLLQRARGCSKTSRCFLKAMMLGGLAPRRPRDEPHRADRVPSRTTMLRCRRP